jgi:tRNA (guanine-N7-)-methyltransferase
LIVSSPKHRFHGRRKGKTLTAYRKDLMESELEKYSLSVIPAKAGISNQVDPSFCWDDINERQTWFEIGFGNGEFLSHISQNHPEINLIGCEPFMNGVAALLASLDKPVHNLKIWHDDARILMDTIPDASLNRVYLLNPDPWPKTRHHKRRFVQTETLDDIARLLKPNGQFIMSTDVADLANWMHEKTWNHDAFEWTSTSQDDWLSPPTDWPLDKTRYMKKALGGETIYWLKFKRI